jgi:hypothetical protein
MKVKKSLEKVHWSLKVKYNITQLQKAKYVVPLKKKTHAQMITNLMENLTSIKISKQVKISGTVLNRGPDRPLTDTCVAAVAVVRFSFLPTEMWCFVHLFSQSATRFNYQFFPAFLSRTGIVVLGEWVACVRSEDVMV